MNKVKNFKLLVSLLLFFLILLPAVDSIAQNLVKVSGVVFEAGTNNTLPGANIYIPNTTKGTTTNIDGAYELRLNPGTYQLAASFIGFDADTVTIEVEPGSEKVVNFRLSETSIQGEEVVIYADRVARRVQQLANLRNQDLKGLQNYTVRINKLGLVYETRKSKKKQSTEDRALADSLNKKLAGTSGLPAAPEGDPIAYSERVVRQMYITPKTFTEKYLARRSSKNFFSEYEIFSTGGSPLNLNEDRVELNILSEVVTVVGPISKSAPQFYELKEQQADSTWPDNTTKIVVTPKTQTRPLFQGEVFVNDDTNKIIGMDLKMNEAGEVFTGVYSMSNFKYFQKYGKIGKYWLPERTEIQGKIGIIGLKNDFIFRDIWTYTDYQINEEELSRQSIPLSDMLVAQKADNRDTTYWNNIKNSYDEVSLQQLQEAQSYNESRFLVNFLMASFRAYYRAPTFLENSYFTNVSDFYRFNRVEGHFLGVGLRTPAVNERFAYKGAVGNATESDDWRYYVSGQQFIPGTSLALEAGYYKKLAIQFADYEYKISPLNVDEFRYTLQTGFSGFDPRNYFERKGFNFGLKYEFRDAFFLRANYMQEDQSFLPIIAAESFFNSFEVGGDVVDPNLNPNVGNVPLTGNPDQLDGFTPGEFSGFEFQLHFDNRQFRQNGVFRNYEIRKFGWFTDHLAYWSDNDFDFDSNENDGFNYVKYRSSFGFRLPMFSSNFLLGEMYIGASNNPLPAQMQFSNNGFYVEDYVRRRPFITLGFNEGIGNRIMSTRLDYDFGSSLIRKVPIRFIRQSGVQFRVWGAAGYRHDVAGVKPVTPWTDGAKEQIEVGISVTHILGIFSAEVGFRIEGDAGDHIGLTVLF